jgi:hypothetical protein
MSIAAISRQFSSAVRESAATTPPVESAAPTRAPAREQGRRHELVSAMSQAMGMEGEQTKAAEQAVFRFAHSLMHDLRTMVGEATEGPRAWGRRDWGDLSQRLSALAAAASPAAPAAPAAPAVPAAVDPVALPVLAAPDVPNPVTTATAAVHIMKVPSSHLLEAFVSLQRALGQQTDTANPRDALADLAKRLSTALTPTATNEIPAGSLFDIKA